MRMARIATYFASCFVCLFLAQLTWGSFKHRLIARIIAIHSRWFLRALRVEVEGKLPEGHYFIIANHLSYIDIPVLASLKPTMFVTSLEMGRKPVIGLLARLADCLLVDRRRFTTLLKDLKELTLLLDSGQTVTLFPEATTSSSGNILPFKPSLVSAAIHSGIPILAVAIRYPSATKQDKHEVFYYGEMQVFPHIKQRLKAGNLKVEVEVCGVVDPHDFQNRKQLAKHLFQIISEKTLKY